MMKSNMISRRPRAAAFIAILILAGGLLYLGTGCGESDTGATTRATQTTSRTSYTTPTRPSTASRMPGIPIDPNLQSATGTPSADEMKVLIGLQAKVPYPVLVPTDLPGSTQLDPSLVSSGAIPGDPSGYYSYEYSDPNNGARTLTFNQSASNSKDLAGYYLTEEEISGTTYQVYWHRTREYLPTQGSTPTTSIVNAETFVITWKGQWTDAAGASHDLYYGLTTGTWTGWQWGDISNILASMKPLSQVGQ